MEFFDQEKSISIKDIQKLEQLSGLNFPDSYKKHILKYNGGSCIPNIFKFIENGEETESDLNTFLSLPDELKDYIIDFKIDELRIPKDMLPIAEDSGGNLICICCDKENNGKIYFWDHESEGFNNLHFIANNLDDFLGSFTMLD